MDTHKRGLGAREARAPMGARSTYQSAPVNEPENLVGAMLLSDRNREDIERGKE